MIILPFTDSQLTGGITPDPSATNGFYALLENVDSLVAQLNVNPYISGKMPVIDDFGAGIATNGDWTNAIASAIAYMRTSGGAQVGLLNHAYRCSTGFSMPTASRFVGQGRGCSKFLYTGPNSGAFVLFPNATADSALIDLSVDVGTATGMTGVLMQDSLSHQMRSVNIIGPDISAGSIALRVQGGNGGTGTAFNSAFHKFWDVGVTNFQEACQLDGIATGPTVATDCSFYDFHYTGSTTGLRAAQWCDSHHFYNMYGNMTSNGSIFAVLNDSATPGSDVGVYNINFYDPNCDAFGGLSGCTMFFLNVMKQCQAISTYHSPVTFPGTLVNDNSGRAISFWIGLNQISGADNSIQQYTKLALQQFANDAAAAAGGINIGGMYATSGVVHVRLT